MKSPFAFFDGLIALAITVLGAAGLFCVVLTLFSIAGVREQKELYVDDWASIIEVPILETARAEIRSVDHIAIRPNPLEVPGSYFKQITLDDIKKSGYSKSVRDVPESLKRKICERDGVKWADRDRWECDHLIPLCLGGTNDPTNLWMQPHFGEWNSLQKDACERRALQEVRDEKQDLRKIQIAFARDWTVLAKDLFEVGAFGAQRVPEEEIGADEQ
jgi:hypothetical protein